MTAKGISMMIKGFLLALAIASTYTEAQSNNPQKRAYNGPSKNGQSSSSGYGRQNGSANRTSGNRRRRPMNGQFRRRRRRPAGWKPSNYQAPEDNSPSYSDNGDKCTANLRATCCDLGSNLSVQDKKDVCDALGCDYDKCDWSETKRYGYGTAKPTSEPTWAADGWEHDGWNDDGYVCTADDQDMCCGLPSTISDYMKKTLCNEVGCDYDKCDWSDDGYDTDEPTSYPTVSPTEWKGDEYKVCDAQSRDICCNQDDYVSVNDKKKVCDRLGCMYKKCGWKRDGYEDDDYDSKPAWKNDGYNNKKDYDDKYDDKYDGNYDDKYDDKYDVDYNEVKDRYDEQWNNYKKRNNGGDDDKDYGDDDKDYGSDDDKYGHVNDYDDDKCTSDERRVCCLANEKKQWKVCNMLGCNVKKCDKRDWDDDGRDNYTNNMNVRYNNRIPTARPTYRNNPYYMDRYNNRPTARPTYRTHYSGQYPQYNSYSPPTPYNPYAPPTPYNPYSIYTPPTWQGDSYTPPTYGYKGSEGDAWNGDSYKKLKTKKPTASPTLSQAPSLSSAPSMVPSESTQPSISARPSKADKKPKYGGYDKSYTKKYEQDMKTMKEDLQELKQLLQMSITQGGEDEASDADDSATEAAAAETTQLKAEIDNLKVLIAEAYVQDEVDEEDTDYLETTLSEVEAEVVEVEKVLDEKKAKKEEKKKKGE